MKILTLYHGTDARMLEMSEAERKQYLADCNLAIDAMTPIMRVMAMNKNIMLL